MLNSKKLLPKYYTEESRDFQLLEHLFDLAFNVSKTAIDSFNYSDEGIYNENLLDLYCTTVGFFKKHSYNNELTTNVVKNFKSLVRNKGKLEAIEDAVRILINAQNLNSSCFLKLDKNYDLVIYLPTEFKNTLMLEEILDYILPAGFTYKIILKDVSLYDSNSLNNFFKVDNDVIYFKKVDSQITEDNNLIGLDVIDIKKKLSNITTDNEHYEEVNTLDSKETTPSVNTMTITHEIKQ